jgi:hypothetical protein
LIKEPKTYNGEKIAFSTNVVGKTGYPYVEDIWICLNIRPETTTGNSRKYTGT